MPTLNSSKPRHRKVYAELPPRIYLELELEAFERDVSPYVLASQILARHFRERLQNVTGAPESPGPSSSSSVAGHE